MRKNIQIWLLASACLLSGCGSDGTSGGGSVVLPSPTSAPTPSSSPSPPTGPEKPSGIKNIVVFLVDDLANIDANFMRGFSKNRATPQIDALAQESLVLQQFHVSTPLCTPSRYTFLTGRYASKSLARQYRSRLESEGSSVPEYFSQITSAEDTLPKKLRRLGFKTGIAGKNHVTQSFEFKGIDFNSSISNPGVKEAIARSQLENIKALNDIGFDEVECLYPGQVDLNPVIELRVHNLDCITKGAIDFIERNKAKKFFLVDALTIPHTPLKPEFSWRADPSLSAYGRLPAPPQVLPTRESLSTRVAGMGKPGDENFLWLDDSVGAVISKLKSEGLLESTLILFMGDHGMEGKGSIYYSGSHTPAFIYYKGKRGASQALISNVDIYNTFLDILGLEGEKEGDGYSFSQLLTENTFLGRSEVFLELGYARSIISDKHQYIAVRHSDYIRNTLSAIGKRPTHWPRYDGPQPLELAVLQQFPSFYDADQLYDLSLDPSEKRNVITNSAYRPNIDAMQSRMSVYVSGTPGRFVVK